MKHARDDYDRIQDPAGLIPDDEPVFLLRAQDKSAPDVLRYWADENVRNDGELALSELAEKWADKMEEWQRQHGCKPADGPHSPTAANAGGLTQHIPGNFTTHRTAWRDAITECINHELNSNKLDRAAYWEHELAAYDRSFARLLDAPETVRPTAEKAPVQDTQQGVAVDAASIKNASALPPTDPVRVFLHSPEGKQAMEDGAAKVRADIAELDRHRSVSADRLNTPMGTIAGPVPAPDALNRAEFINRIVLSVAEIPDRDSPEDQPEMMLVTADELRGIITSAFEVEDEREPVSQAAPDARDVVLEEAAMACENLPDHMFCSRQDVFYCSEAIRALKSKATPPSAAPAIDMIPDGDGMVTPTLRGADSAIRYRTDVEYSRNGSTVTIHRVKATMQDRAVITGLPGQPAPADLHAAIMNLPGPRFGGTYDISERAANLSGYREAQNAAAELVAAAIASGAIA